MNLLAPAGAGHPFAVRRAAGTVVVTVRGDLDASWAGVLERVLVDLIDGQGNRNVAIHLADDDRLRRPALAALDVAADVARRRGATLTVR